MSLIHPQSNWLVWAVIAILGVSVMLGFTNSLTQGKLMSLSELVKKIMKQEVKITSKAQFRQFMKCLYQGTQGCENVEKGVWDKLKGTPLEGCPCAGEDMEHASYRVRFSFKDKDFIKISKDKEFAYPNVRVWDLGALGGLLSARNCATCVDNPQDVTLRNTFANNLPITGFGWIGSDYRDSIYFSGEVDENQRDYIKIDNQSKARITTDSKHRWEIPLCGVQQLIEAPSGGSPGKALAHTACVKINKAS